MEKYILSKKEQVCQKYGLTKISQMRTEHILDLFENAELMTPELRAAIAKEVPALTKMAADTIKEAQKTAQVSIAKRSEVTKEALKVSDDAIKTIGKIAECSHLSEEERDRMTDKVMILAENAKVQAETTNEDSQASSNMLTFLSYAVLLGAGLFVGYNIDPKLVSSLIKKIRK